jgi:argininosuccinate lyase
MKAPREKFLWSGRFSEGPLEDLRKLNDSFSFDRTLLAEDVACSKAWARAQRAAGLISEGERRRLERGLDSVLAEVRRRGLPSGGFEDVHTFVESRLAGRVGALAGKLGAGRSRNDQVATDLRLWLKQAVASVRFETLELARALAARASEEAATPLPGYTHLKRAIPVTFGHWCLAYVEMLLRDAERWGQIRERADECPLGSGALAGAPGAIDRGKLARSLGFARPTANSLDAVSDRDAAAEYLFAGTLELVHLSRFAEDLILFSSEEFGFVELPDELATGSSRMPHKKNPDLLELARGHAGRAIGELAGLLAVLKGLPLAYDKDLQLDKEPVFRLRAVLAAALPALRSLVERMNLERTRMREAAAGGSLLSTEVADAIAARGVPFRRAHQIVARRVAQAESMGKSLSDLPPGGGVEASDLEAMDLERALGRRSAFGGTAPKAVSRASRAAARKIGRLLDSGRGAGSGR